MKLEVVEEFLIGLSVMLIGIFLIFGFWFCYDFLAQVIMPAVTLIVGMFLILLGGIIAFPEKK
jgi:hypothetical protein